MQLRSPDAPRRILLIDDDVELTQMLREYFEPERWHFSVVHRGADGEALLARDDHDLALLDLMLPDGNGLELLRRHRARSQRPVIMFTAHGDETDRVIGLELGADDYLAKPFSPRELKARIGAVLRRFDTTPDSAPDTLAIGGLTLHLGSGKVAQANGETSLTGAEARILEMLMRSAGQVVGREPLGQFALGRVPGRYDRSIDTHISSLRRKLGLDGSGATTVIRNQRGRGYVLVA
ncbi:response regulator transcription factor [Cupriavidus sp. UGS-1]|uniref:response regulator transcription factor n=1 Tax=Cupriavidus sp. UGS-1 TaxID=2899826 RepID=UPI001E5BA649|nr:response regulator transcription factor [Cupriavidus sp. UGS-1]MCD9119703.1 response regulator transcription factor [Cupriavidus sp. UGS-1]